MPFIEPVPHPTASGPAQEMYRVIEGRVGYVPNWAAPFTLHPEVWQGWDALHGTIRAGLSVRMYELVTLAAARALRSSYCALAHGKVLADKVLDAKGVMAIMDDPTRAPLEPAERALMAFAEKIARHADQVTQEDVDGLRAHGYSDTVIFDAAAAAAARCFFSKLLDAMGVQADARFRDLDPALRDALTVGRPVAAS